MNAISHIYVAVVDDDQSVCRSFARLLRASGMQAVTYESAEAFLADAKRPRFDCLVLDVNLGGMSGIELGRRIAREGGHAPVIYITAHDDPDTRAGVRDAGGIAYFSKSDSGSDVLAAIRRATG